uniref:Uncharacterized protein n=1 Tax=Mesocestoides corti TaxID=53468 RepID=A0A5K3F5G6_MESCO
MWEDADRLVHRVESLVSWYNQRFQLLSCLSLQKMGLFHCLRTPSHLGLLRCAAALGEHVSPPELSPLAAPASTGGGGGGSAVPATVATTPHNPPGSAAAAALVAPTPSAPASLPTASIRRRFLEGLVGAGACPSEALHATLSTALSPGTPSGGDVSVQPHPPQQRLRQGTTAEADFNLTRLYQDCAQIPALHTESGRIIDVVHLHVGQALRAIQNDTLRAGQLRLVTAPLKAWMGGDYYVGDSSSAAATTTTSLNRPSPSASDLRDGSAPSVFYSAVKKFGRTLHTVCSPILFCPLARSEALRLREVERSAEEAYSKLSENSETSEVSLTSAATAVTLPTSPSNRTHDTSRDMTSPVLALSGKVRQMASDSGGFEFLSTAESPKQEKQRVRRRRPVVSRRSRVRRPSGRVPQPTGPLAAPSEQPAWMQQAGDALLQEFIAYMTRQMHFYVIKCSLDGDNEPWSCKMKHPYALLQRSVKMAGIHLLEVFIRHSLFCVRLKAVELCRFTRAASRGIVTGPLAAEQVGRAAAAAAVKITSAIIAADECQQRRNTVAASPPSNASVASPSNPYAIKWEESSRLCDCVHLHSFLYDFYLRNVDVFLKRQSELIGQRIQVPSLTWSLAQPPKQQRAFSQVAPRASRPNVPLRHPFLPATYPIVAFLCDLSVISPLAPVFARGTFTRLRMRLPVDSRIKPEQVFEHLIEERQAYGFKAFDLGVNSSFPTYDRFGFCNFSLAQGQPLTATPDCQRRVSMSRQFSHRTSTNTTILQPSDSALLIASQSVAVPPSNDSDVVTFNNSYDDSSSSSGGELCSVGEVEEEEEDEGNVEFAEAMLRKRPRHKTSVDSFMPQIRLPTLKHFSVACAGFLDPPVDDGCDSDDEDVERTGRPIELSIFVILTDQCRLFPRARLSSLPDGLTSEHQTPVQWPAIRPGLSSENDLNTLSPKLVRSGSQEGAPDIRGEASVLTFPLVSGSRRRHTSMMIRRSGDSVTGSDAAAVVAYGKGAPRKPTTSTSQYPGDTVVLQGDPGLRWKISYLGVWPSHQIELRRALKLVRQAWFISLPHIVNSAMINCHKNLLWYRLFDPQYFPRPAKEDEEEEEEVEEAQKSTANSSPEIGEEVASLYGSSTEGGQFAHKGLSSEEFQDLLNSAPLKLDLLRLDPRLTELLKLSGKHLTSSLVRRINSAWWAEASQATTNAIAFFFESDDAEGTWVHLGVILPTYREGVIHISWLREHEAPEEPPTVVRQEERPAEIARPLHSKLSLLLRSVLATRGAPVEGVSLEETTGDSATRLRDFSMRVVFRSTSSLEVSLRNSTVTSSSTYPQSSIATFYRTPLMNTLKFLVELLTYHIWRDLHTQSN